MNRFLAVLAAVLVYGCDPPVQQQQAAGEDPYHEQFVRTNRYMQMRHQDQIAAFVERVSWEAKQTATGLWIVLEKEGSGPEITDNDIVDFTFSSSLLDGTSCYEADADHPRRIVIGKSEVESGVNEGLKQLKKGSSAIFLIPPHLAHGNFGDRNKIPGNSILIYRIEVQDVRRER